LRGVSSHGITRIPVYVKRLRLGLLNARPNIVVTSNSPATAHVDGDNGMGAVVATKAMDIAVHLAQENGVGLVTVYHSNHFGMAARYVKQAFRKGMAAIVLSNAAPLMPVWGGRTPLLGTNPFAMGIAGEQNSLLLDMATSIVAFGKIRRAARLGQSIPGDWALDANGAPTTDPNAAANGGIVLPMAGPKGSGLALLIDAVCGAVSGSAFAGNMPNQNTNFEEEQNVGHFLLAFDPGCFLPKQEVEKRIDTLVGKAKASEKAVGFDTIFMPGEVEDLRAEERRNAGIEIPVSEIEMLRKEAEAAGFSATL
jgi:LDH2 family malate/lactate/ureidoglycolate dehydrogenase